MPPTSSEIKELTTKVDRLCLLVESEFGTDKRPGRVYIFLEQINKEIQELGEKQQKTDYLLNGNGEEGIKGKVTTLWRERDKKIKAFGHILLGALTTLFGWALAWFFGDGK